MSNQSLLECSPEFMALRSLSDAEPIPPPRATAYGALINCICPPMRRRFQPANITFDLLQSLDEESRRRIRDKKQRHALVCKRALEELDKCNGNK